MFFFSLTAAAACKAINHRRVFFSLKLPLKHRSTTLTRYHLAGLNSYLPRWHKSSKSSVKSFHAYLLDFNINETHLCLVNVEKNRIVGNNYYLKAKLVVLRIWHWKWKPKNNSTAFWFTFLYISIATLKRCIVHESRKWLLLFCVWILLFLFFLQLILHIISLIVSVPCVLFALDVHLFWVVAFQVDWPSSL